MENKRESAMRAATVPVLVNVPVDILTEVDAWRRRQANPPSRTKGVLHFIREGANAVAKAGEEK
ncbi:hypothetical protein [Methylosinus sp. PW1]|uniref:hypothetical protein n=1 Tax=Methylosinus sp. PW1 TaxID=107636 RepID=UPI000562EF3E|nr:hypothetical protein [Methylosinus sp. PW1]